MRPTVANLNRYVKHQKDTRSSEKFFYNDVARGECCTVQLCRGETILIPAGWLHAVFTVKDSIVFGGNFMTVHHIPMQLRWQLSSSVHNKLVTLSLSPAGINVRRTIWIWRNDFDFRNSNSCICMLRSLWLKYFEVKEATSLSLTNSLSQVIRFKNIRWWLLRLSLLYCINGWAENYKSAILFEDWREHWKKRNARLLFLIFAYDFM